MTCPKCGSDTVYPYGWTIVIDGPRKGKHYRSYKCYECKHRFNYNYKTHTEYEELII